MNTFLRTATLLVATAVLAACGAGSSDQGRDTSVVQLSGNGSVAATINGVKVPEPLLDAVAKVRGLDISVPEQREKAMDDLSQYVLLAEQAPKLKVRQQADLAASMEVARLQGVANAVLLAYNRNHPVTDDMVAEDYARQIKEAGDKTYRFTQLLFEDEAEADKVAAELAAGKSFTVVYDEWSSNARDAQSFSEVFPRQLPPQMAAVLTTLKPGESTKTPILTNLGWHLLHLDGVDPFQPPPLDQVRDKVRSGMEQKQVQAWLGSLKSEAKIIIEKPDAVTSLGPANATTVEGSGKALSSEVAKDEAPARAGSAR